MIKRSGFIQIGQQMIFALSFVHIEVKVHLHHVVLSHPIIVSITKVYTYLNALVLH